MNKILKIIIKPDPVFRYIVEDYPFYEGLFFHSIDFHNMNVHKTHYFLRQNLVINQGISENFYIPKFNLRLNSFISLGLYKSQVNPKFKLKRAFNFSVLNSSRIQTRLNLRPTMNDKNYSKSKINLHMIKLTKLKTHDPYPLENRDTLPLSSMDGEKFL